MSDEAMSHLGNVLMILAELHPDDRCRALDEALAFYNERRPNAQVAPVDGYVSRLVNFSPLDAAIFSSQIQTEDGVQETVVDRSSLYKLFP